MTTVTLQNKNEVVLNRSVKLGVDPRIMDIENLTFNDVLLPNGTLVKDATFQQLQDTLWSYQGKNQTTMTDVTKP